MKTNNILAIGNALTDMLCVLDSDELINKIGVERGSMHTVSKDIQNELLKSLAKYDVKKVRGGSAPNTLGGVAKLGATAGFIGKVGKDEIADFFRNDLKERGIKDQMIVSEDMPSGTCVALISPDGERTFLTCLGAASELQASDLNAQMFEGYGICHVDGYLLQNYDLIESALYLAKQSGAKVSLDLASFNVVKDNLEFLKRIIHDYVDVVFANEEESKAYTGLEPDAALDAIAEQVDYAIVKVGGRGSLAKHGSERQQFSPLPNVKCIDTTGAGDLYAAGFLYALGEGKSLYDCGRIGTIVSGNVVEVVGTKMPEERWQRIRAMI